MATNSRSPLKSSLPPVLNQYLPKEQQQQQHESSAPGDSGKSVVVTSPSKNDPLRPKNKNNSDKENQERAGRQQATQSEKTRTSKSVTMAAAEDGKNKPAPKKGKGGGGGGGTGGGGRGHHPPPPKREATGFSMMSTLSGRSGRRKNEAEEQRLEHVADVWDQARQDVLSERHQQLQEKVALQQRLVRAQDLHASSLRQQQQQQQELKRQEDKKKKQSKEAELQDICRQSLDADKQKASELRASNTAAAGAGHQGGKLGRRSEATRNHSSNTASSFSSHSGDGHVDGSVTATTTTTTNDNDDEVFNAAPTAGAEAGAVTEGPGDRGSRRHRGYRPSQGLPEYQLPSTPMRELEDEGDEAGDDYGQGGGYGRKDVPSHHAQLYELYGKQADYFLHPKPPPAAQQTQRRQTHPKLRAHKGHIGAGELWDTLRKDSKDKLIRSDMRFPKELKSAFGAFVRERLTKHVRPVERSFCATEDVPDIQRLMDQSKLRNTRMYRHKTQLMYRSSITNRDRTSILLHNNPMPDVTVSAQADSISRYLPSWMDDASEVSEPEYMKWIKARGEHDEDAVGGGEDKENVRRSAHSRQLSETTRELDNIWHTIATRKKQPSVPRIQFLTEKDAETEGAFTQRFQEEKEQREKPQAHHVMKSHSALNFSFPTSAAYTVSPTSRERGQSAMQLQRYQSDWEPLSMTALVEYKKQRETEGQGEFHHGRVRMWPTTASSAVA